MGKVFDGIDDHLRGWIGRQRLFFVGSAPLAADGHINVSPQGPIDALAVPDEHAVAYLDIVGSGAETIAHLRENGRIVVMLCAFEGPPRIVRLHGRGEVITPEHEAFETLLAQGFHEPQAPEARRAIIRVHVTRISDSCGYGVPLLAYEGERPQGDLSTLKRLRVHGPNAMREYEAKHNRTSIDGLPALS